MQALRPRSGGPGARRGFGIEHMLEIAGSLCRRLLERVSDIGGY